MCEIHFKLKQPRSNSKYNYATKHCHNERYACHIYKLKWLHLRGILYSTMAAAAERVLISKPSVEASNDVRGPRSGICSFPACYNPLMNWGTLKAVSNWNPVVRSISSGHSLRSGGVEAVERNGGRCCSGLHSMEKGVQQRAAKMALSDTLLRGEGQ